MIIPGTLIALGPEFGESVYFSATAQQISNIPAITRLNQAISFLDESEFYWSNVHCRSKQNLTDSRSSFTGVNFC